MSRVTRFARPAAATTDVALADILAEVRHNRCGTSGHSRVQAGLFSASRRGERRGQSQPGRRSRRVAAHRHLVRVEQFERSQAGGMEAVPGAAQSRDARGSPGEVPSTSLSGSTASRARSSFKVPRHGRLDEQRVDCGIRAERADNRLEVLLVTSPDSSSCTDSTPISSQSWCFIATYRALDRRPPTRIVPSPGVAERVDRPSARATALGQPRPVPELRALPRPAGSRPSVAEVALAGEGTYREIPRSSAAAITS